MLQLYHHGSSVCAAKVRLALAEKHLDWRGHYIDLLKGEQFTPGFLAINPKAVVPVLVHDDVIIQESTVICEYLEETFADHPIYPASPRQRAAVLIWTKAVDEELHPACSAITYTVSHRHSILRNGVGSFEDFLKASPSEGVTARQLKWQWIEKGLAAPGAADKIRLYDGYLHQMEEALTQSAWVAGETFSMADIAMALTLIGSRRSEWKASGPAEGCPMWSAGLVGYATARPSRLRSPNGCRRRWPAKCARTVRAPGRMSREF